MRSDDRLHVVTALQGFVHVVGSSTVSSY